MLEASKKSAFDIAESTIDATKEFSYPVLSMDEALEKTKKYDGYKTLRILAPEIRILDLDDEASRANTFSNLDDKDRVKLHTLKRKIDVLLELLDSEEDVATLVEKSYQQAEFAEKLLSENLQKTLNKLRPLEESYRSLMIFFENTGLEKIDNLTLVNASLNQITNLDKADLFIEPVQREINAGYNQISLQKHYSLLVIPGYLKRGSVVDKWARIASEHKLMLVTDFKNSKSLEDLLLDAQDSNLTSADEWKTNVMMASNWLVGRGRYDKFGEKEDLFVPPSVALAGRMYSSLMSQPVAGFKQSVYGIDGVRLNLKLSELRQIYELGIIPMTLTEGKIHAYSDRTLFTGANPGYRVYSIVRVMDYVSKVIMDYLNKNAFDRINQKNMGQIKQELINFLDSIKGDDKLILDHRLNVRRISPQDIQVTLSLEPMFPAKAFIVDLSLTGSQDINSNDISYSSSTTSKAK